MPKSKQPAKKAISYLRYSSKKQGEGGSENRQQEWAQEYCAQHGLILVDTYKDLGISAHRGKHSKEGNLARLIGDCQSGKVPKGYVLIIENFDRLSREQVPVALQRFLTLINDYGLEIHTLDDNRVYHAGNIELVELIITIVIMGRAHSESERKSVLTTKAWKQLRDPKPLKKKPMGRLPSWIYWDEDTSALQCNSEAVKTIEYIFDLLTEKKLSTMQIARRLVAEEVPLFKDSKAKQWTSTMVSKLAYNKSLLGELHPATTKDTEAQVVEGYYPEVITREQFDRAAQLIRSRITKPKGRPPKYTSQHAILTGVTYYLGSRVHKGYYRSRRKSGDTVIASYVSKHDNRNVYIGLGDPLEHFVCSIIEELDSAELSQNPRNKALELKLAGALASKQKELIRLNGVEDNLTQAIKLSSSPIPTLVQQLEGNQQEVMLCKDAIADLEQQLKEVTSGSGVHDKEKVAKLKKQALETKDLQSRQEMQVALGRLAKRIDLAKVVEDLPDCSNDFVMHALTLHATSPVKFWAKIQLFNDAVILGAMTHKGAIARIRWEEDESL